MIQMHKVSFSVCMRCTGLDAQSNSSESSVEVLLGGGRVGLMGKTQEFDLGGCSLRPI